MPQHQRSCQVQNLSAQIPHENFVGAVLTGRDGGVYKVQSLKLQRDYLDIWSVTTLGGGGRAGAPPAAAHQQLEAKAFFLACPVQKRLEAEAKKMRRISSKRTWVERIDLPSSGKRMLVSAIERSRAEWDNLVHATTGPPARRGSCSSMDCDEEYPRLSASYPPSSAASSASSARSSSRATTRMSMYSDSDVVSEPDTERSFPRPPSSCAGSSSSYYAFHHHHDQESVRRTYAETLADGLQTVKRKAASAGKGIRQNRRRRRKREERRQQKIKAEAEKNGQGV